MDSVNYRKARMAFTAAFAALAVPVAMLAATGAANASSPPPARSAPRTAGWARISRAEGRHFVALYARYRHIPESDVARAPRGEQLARVRRGNRWAMVSFLASSRASLAAQVGFQDGGRFGIFRRSPRGMWKMTGVGSLPLGCSAGLPASVLKDWHLASCPSLKPAVARQSRPRRGTGGSSPAIADVSGVNQIADVAIANVGITDNPASTFCNAFTAMETPGAPSSGCGTDSRYGIQDRSEEWCADFAKYVWQASGVTGDVSTLSAAAKSFDAWGYNYGETISFDGSPAPGDALVFFPAGTTLASVQNSNVNDIPAADHVALDVGVSSGNPDLVNGDFGYQSGDDAVEQSDDITNLTTWTNTYVSNGDKWVVVTPNPGISGSAPAVGVNPSNDQQYVFWRGSNLDLYEAYYKAGSWNGPENLVSTFGFGSSPASSPSVAVSSDGNEYMFWAGTNGDIYEAYFTASSGTWNTQDMTSAQSWGSTTSAVSVGVNPSNDQQYVFWRGTNGDLYEGYYKSGGWNGPQDLNTVFGFGNNIASAPSVAVASDGNEYVYWRGTEGDIYEAYFTASSGNWNSQDMTSAQGWGSASSAISVGVNPSNDYQYVFWRGVNGDLYQAYYKAGNWTGPQDLASVFNVGNNIASAPSVSVANDGNEYVFYRGFNDDIYEAYYTASSGSWNKIDMTSSKGWTQ
jgi:hypothetical protein